LEKEEVQEGATSETGPHSNNNNNNNNNNDDDDDEEDAFQNQREKGFEAAPCQPKESR
jgi:hypothetical protein